MVITQTLWFCGTTVLTACLAGMAWGAPPAAPRPPAGAQGPSPAPRDIQQGGFRVRLDVSTQVLGLSVPDDRGYGSNQGPVEPPLSARLTDLGSGEFVSASVLDQKAKQFDDGLYAAVDLAADAGAGSLGGKAAMLKTLATALVPPPGQSLTQAPATILAAAELGKLGLALPPETQTAVSRAVDEFLHDQLHSKPISFYTWTAALSALFQQDRMLQRELKDAPGTTAIVKALQAHPAARATYQAYLQMVGRLTNPPPYPDLTKLLTDADHGPVSAPDRGVYFLPPSQSYEGELVKQLFGMRPIPEGFSLVDEMITRIRDGRLSLQPHDESGWYDYQTWSLEPLVIPAKMPEAERLQFAESYRKQLVELFKGILALTRETHAKQLEIPMVGMGAPLREVVINIAPELSAEPLATHYYRRAWSYVFIRWALEQSFGPDALKQLHRLTAAGPVAATLAAELQAMTDLFYGAHVSVCRQIGMPPVVAHQLGSGRGDAADAAPLPAWSRQIADDPDVSQDARMMVPVFYDVQRKLTKVWVFLGWSRRPLTVSFAKQPTATVFDAAGQPAGSDAPRLAFHAASYQLIYPVSAEVYVTQILNRDEFRRVCDQFQTRSAILANLK